MESGWGRRKWFRWAEGLTGDWWLKPPELGARLGCHSIAKSVEPGTRVEILPSSGKLGQDRVVGMSHDQKPNPGMVGQELFRPCSLSRCCPRQLCLVHRVIPQYRAQEIHEPQPHVGVQYPVDRGRRGMLDQPVNQLGLPARLRQTIAVNGSDRSTTDIEGCSMRTEGHPEIPLPEITIPPVVVAAHHDDRDLAAEAGDRRGDVKTASGYDSGIGEPEVEEIAVDQQAIAQGRHGVEELEENFLGSRRRHSKVGVGHDHEGVAEHGAKDGLPLTPVQPEPAGAVSAMRFRTSNP